MQDLLEGATGPAREKRVTVYVLTAGKNPVPLGAHATWRDAVAQANGTWPNRTAFQPNDVRGTSDSFTWRARSQRNAPGPGECFRPHPVSLYITSLLVSYEDARDFAVGKVAA